MESTHFLEILIVYCVHAENNQCSCSTQYEHFQISEQNFSLTTTFGFFICFYFSFLLALLLYFFKKILVSIWLPFLNRIQSMEASGYNHFLCKIEGHFEFIHGSLYTCVYFLCFRNANSEKIPCVSNT